MQLLTLQTGRTLPWQCLAGQLVRCLCGGLLVLSPLFDLSYAAEFPSCQQAVGTKLANIYVRQCLQVSPASSNFLLF